MRVGYQAEAKLEFAEAVQHYLEVDSRVAEDFVSEIDHGVAEIQRSPLTWRIVEADVRRYLIQRFPFGIYYSFEEDFITIWSISHLSRDADHWKMLRWPKP